LLNSTASAQDDLADWNNTAPTATVFSVGTPAGTNINGATYVAYLFAHNAGGFGLTGTDNVISCGSYTGNGSTTGPVIDLGYEPQWLMIKYASGSGEDWAMFDNMRDMSWNNTALLKANTSGAESTSDRLRLSATGFQIISTTALVNINGGNYIYIAIRRGPMKVPTSGTSVFDVDLAGNASAPTMTSAFPVDLGFIARRSGGDSWYWVDRLRGTPSLSSDTTAAEASFPTLGKFDYMNGYGSSTTLTAYTGWNFRRAPSFFDEVCYTGTGADLQLTHNLNVAPELIIAKSRSTTYDWRVVSNFGSVNYNYGFLNDTQAFGSISYASDVILYAKPDASKVYLGPNAYSNNSGDTYVAYLFATCVGVSKVGSYTGNGSTQTIDCGFTGGARFVMVKATSTTGNWIVADSARGIVAGNDPALYLNSTAAEVTGLDWIDADNSGFVVNETATIAANTNGVSYIFLAIA